MEILTGQEMRNVDRRAIEELGIPSLDLMEAAGRGVADAFLSHYPDATSCGVVILCGKGNNGGDGLVAARHLTLRGLAPRVVLLAPPDLLKGDAATNLEAARSAGVKVESIVDAESWSEARGLLADARYVIDAILGTGVEGGARGLAAAVIDDLNRSDSTVISIDLPSGLDADTFRVEGPAVRADRTYTLCRPKLALVMPPASLRSGRWSLVSIGIPDDAVRDERSRLEWLDAAAASTLLPAREVDAHKGTLGHLLAVAGSQGKSGAAVLLARGALRSGVGLITVAAPASSCERIAVQQAELMTEPLEETGSACLACGSVARILELASTRSALAVGPGLGTEEETGAAVREVIERRDCPTVLDADGLNAFVSGDRRPEELTAGSRPLVLTPHPGEAARLLGTDTGEIQADRLGAARRLAERSGATVVLKGHRSVVTSPDGRMSINASGNAGMATAGTGDVLTGIVGAFLARGLAAFDAARLAVFVHGDAGDRAAARVGQEGLIASDLVAEIPAALLALGRGRE